LVKESPYLNWKKVVFIEGKPWHFRSWVKIFETVSPLIGVPHPQVGTYHIVMISSSKLLFIKLK